MKTTDNQKSEVDQQRLVRPLVNALRNILESADFTLSTAGRDKWERGELNINTLRPAAEKALRDFEANDIADLRPKPDNQTTK